MAAKLTKTAKTLVMLFFASIVVFARLRGGVREHGCNVTVNAATVNAT
jgi:hypothetical protein